MPQEHRKYLSFNADEFTEWSASVGFNTSKVVEYFLKSGKAPEQGYKFCVSLVRLDEIYGVKLLEGACERMLSLSSAPSIRSISSILKSSQGKPENESESEEFGITRGAAYFRKGDNRNIDNNLDFSKIPDIIRFLDGSVNSCLKIIHIN